MYKDRHLSLPARDDPVDQGDPIRTFYTNLSGLILMVTDLVAVLPQLCRFHNDIIGSLSRANSPLCPLAVLCSQIYI